MKNQLVKYDNTFNKTSLTLFTKVQSDVLISILSKMGNNKKELNYKAVISFKEIRKMTESKNLHVSRIKQALDKILDTKVEFYKNGSFIKANLFSHYEINENKYVEIVLTDYMTEKLTLSSSEYTILELDEYVKLPNSYSKELYRMLRQFKHSGLRIIAKKELIRMLNPPKSYNEYDFVRKVLIPAINENKVFFENLSANIGPQNSLPNVVEFKFKAHESIKTESNKLTMEEELLEHIKNNS